MITQCQEIRSEEGGLIQLYKDDYDHNCISVIDNGRIFNLFLKHFDKEELIIILRHIKDEIEKK